MLFSVENLHFGYLDVPLIEGVNLTFNDGDRIGLIGGNGVGKTTFLHLILKELVPWKGSISYKSNLSIGVLRQNEELNSQRNVWQELTSVFEPLRRIEEQMRALEQQMSEGVGNSAINSRYHALENAFLARDGYHTDVRARTVAFGMGFADRLEQQVTQLSGGEKTRLALCKLLLSDLDLLILDEPTNHLDMETLEWLEKYLATYKGGLLVVSHDRSFLDHVVGKIWDMEDNYIREYRFGYTKSREVKAELVEASLRAYNRQQEQIADMLEYAERNGVRASTAKSAKSRLNRIAGMDILERPITYTPSPTFGFPIPCPCNRDVLKVTEMPLVVGDVTLVPSVSFEIKAGDKVAIVGTNGVGKTTLLKTLLGLINNRTDHYNVLPTPNTSACPGGVPAVRSINGHIKYGINLAIGYYDQENLNLDTANNLLGELWFRFPNMTQTTARAMLARMLFSAEDMDKRVSALSGGERAKLGFAILSCEKSNLLFLDEPTNHLDLASREALEEALRRFEGTLIFVSHDRYFINAVANKVLYITPSGATMLEGNYDSYLKYRDAEREGEQKTQQKADVPKSGNYKTKEDKRKETQKRETIARLEKALHDVEEEMARLNEELADTTDYKRCAELSQALVDATSREEELYNQLAEWME